MILQVYNWSIVISAIIIIFTCINDKDFQDGMPLGLNKYVTLFISIVPILNTFVIFYYIYTDIIQPIKHWIILKIVLWKVRQIVKKFNKRQLNNDKPNTKPTNHNHS